MKAKLVKEKLEKGVSCQQFIEASKSLVPKLTDSSHNKKSTNGKFVLQFFLSEKINEGYK